MSSPVIVERSLLRIDGITIHNPDVVQYFRNKPEEERVQVLVRVVELGVFCLQRAEVGQSLEFVKLEVERLIQASSNAVEKLPEEIRSKLSGQDSPTAQISSAVQSVQTSVQGKLDEVRSLFDTHLDPTKGDATLGKALIALNGLLDPRRDDSVQKRVEATVQSLSGIDGAISQAVKTTVESVVAPLRTAVETLSLAVARESGTQEALAASPEKGFQFEEELQPGLHAWAASVGAELEFTAPQNQPGDFTLALRDTSVSGLPLKIVIEARDREQAFGRIPILRQMTDALSQWKGNFGIYVSKTQTGLAGEIGEWSELCCERGPIVACTVEHLKTALRFAVVDTRLRAAAQPDKQIDTRTVAAELGRFRDSLNHLTQIKRKVGEIRQILDILPSIETEADQMRNVWHIRDFGRGLRYEHLTQNENQEKLKNPSRVIGKFGVGLKDALATLNRRKIKVLIRSKHGDITLGQTAKHGFPDVVTLHAMVNSSDDPAFEGTDVALEGVSDADVAAAKNFFLKFSNQSVLDETSYGQILAKDGARNARIYVTGMLVAEEENFAFSYNITSLTATMRKALNRERTNVGRTAYTDRVKQMLLASSADTVADTLAGDLQKLEAGTNHDEVKWMDVAVHACQILNASKKVVFVTANDLSTFRDAIEHAQSDGMKIVTVPENVKESLRGVTDLKGNPVRDLGVYQKEWAESFEFKFVSPDKLTSSERKVFEQRVRIASLVGGLPKKVKNIKVSETMRPDFLTGNITQGLWEESSNSIIILRKQLGSMPDFAGTLLHEIAHAKTGYDDVSREFESALTEMLGQVATSGLS